MNYSDIVERIIALQKKKVCPHGKSLIETAMNRLYVS